MNLKDWGLSYDAALGDRRVLSSDRIRLGFAVSAIAVPSAAAL